MVVTFKSLCSIDICRFGQSPGYRSHPYHSSPIKLRNVSTWYQNFGSGQTKENLGFHA